ncbi:hypothetical protein [Streptomyces virginiae]|uniref:hypothetical protein n=1 Tax=Streptomyces virginiae TaxID=1961 RepID=UPI0022523426|nr:hypothetical protein [Streptomyces virginiae]MCX4960076.1 hypothetical protein [Streptomyces virginiae]
MADDIRAASDHLREVVGFDGPFHVVAASFSGGAAALHAAYRLGLEHTPIRRMLSAARSCG